MTEQRGSSTHPSSELTPDQVSAENELICEKLLGWRFDYHATDEALGKKVAVWRTASDETCDTPSFTTWAEAGLILDWLMGRIGPGLERLHDDLALDMRRRTFTPAMVRDATIKYLRSLP